MKKYCIFGLCAAAALATACTDDPILVPNSLYVGESTTFTLSAMGGTREIEIKTSTALKLELGDYADWYVVEFKDNKVSVTVPLNEKPASRTTTFYLIGQDRKLDITLIQQGQPNTPMKVTNVTASSNGSANYKSNVVYDGDFGNAFWYTNASDDGGIHWLEFEFEQNSNLQVVGVTYYPRIPNKDYTGFPNGCLGRGTVYAKTASTADFEKVTDFEIERVLTDAYFLNGHYIEFPQPLKDVVAIKFEVDGSSTNNNPAAGSFSAREIVFNATARMDVSKFVMPEKESYSISKNGAKLSVGIVNNCASVSASSDAAWCSAVAENGFVEIQAGANTDGGRMATVTVTGEDGGMASFKVIQPAGNAAKIAVSDFTALNKNGESIEGGDGTTNANIYDGDMSNYWHSDYGSNNLVSTGPYTLDFTLNGTLSYIRYYPRSYQSTTKDIENNPTGGNGNFGKIEVWTKTSDTYQKQMDYDCGEKGAMSEIVLPLPVEGCTGVRIIVNGGRGNHASATEMEFWGTPE